MKDLKLILPSLSILAAGLFYFADKPVVTAEESKQDRDGLVAEWTFDGKPEPGFDEKTAKKTVPGPKPPVHPKSPEGNTAFSFNGAKGVTVKESDLPGKNLRFTNGDSITLESWVRVGGIKDHAYIIGKGRSGHKGYPEHNQNYSLRVSSAGSSIRLNFLFGSAPDGKVKADWHRWTSNSGFARTGWHHVAVSYTFGEPESIRGYVDGEEVKGKWDMGGATKQAPYSDDDDLAIGGRTGLNNSNTLAGDLDDIRIWRRILTAEEIASRYSFEPPPPPVTRDIIPAGKVLMQICEEGMPDKNAWPAYPLEPSETYHERAFGFSHYPLKYVDTGVREDRPNPFLIRAAALVDIPEGEHRILLRGRGGARLTIDGKEILTNPFPTAGSSAHGKVKKEDEYLNLGPDFRFATPGDQEKSTTYKSDGKPGKLVILETSVGGFFGTSPTRRPELGETVVAISPEGSEFWWLLTPAGAEPVRYNDESWEDYAAEREAVINQLNADKRAAQRAQHDEYWKTRREQAQKWLAATGEVPVPKLPENYPALNPIDHFIADRIAGIERQLGGDKPGQVNFHKDVLPLLEAKCFDCHAGGNSKGGLRLDEAEAAFKGGKYDGHGIKPGKPAESAILARMRSKDPDEVMPPKGEPFTEEQIKIIEKWIEEGARWPDLEVDHTTLTPLTDDLSFLRRVALDTVGVVPSEQEINDFLKDTRPNKRALWIDKYLDDPRWADKNMGYWQDLLAENPNILNPTLNNTGPFRWWIHESFLDNKPADLMVTELLRMRGSNRFGGPAGFRVAAQNDAPAAEKGVIVASAFLGIEMKCARCHDAPAHSSTQQDLFELAALIDKKPITLPATSSVPLDKIHQGGRKPLITVTLKPGTKLEPKWPFEEFVAEEVGSQLAQYPDDFNDKLAALITAPENERFAQVLTNRIWKQYMGRGIVEPVDDWERGKASHPELLGWLSREFVRNGYDFKALSRIIMNSHAYQRATDRSLKATTVLYTAPAPRRLTAEQIVDSLYAATGKPMKLEEVSLDINGRRSLQSSISLGVPKRAWMLTSTSNERDRPSLSLPRIQAVCDVLEAFGWRGARKESTSSRDMDPTVLQPAIMSNGAMATWVTRLSDDHGITDLALAEQPLDQFVDRLFLRILTRKPTNEEKAEYLEYLKEGYNSRIQTPEPKPQPVRKPKLFVTWTNHLSPEANLLKQLEEEEARRGDPPTDRLDPNWRVRLEDALWALLNSPEFIFTP